MRHFISREQIHEFIVDQEVSEEAVAELRKLALGGKWWLTFIALYLFFVIFKHYESGFRKQGEKRIRIALPQKLRKMYQVLYQSTSLLNSPQNEARRAIGKRTLKRWSFRIREWVGIVKRVKPEQLKKNNKKYAGSK